MSEQPIETCPECGGCGFRDVVVDGVPAGVKPCECKKQNLPQRLMAAAKIPKRYANCRLDNYTTRKDAPHLEMALIKAAGYVDQYSSQPTAKGLLFQGSPGLGKTHLAVGVLRDLIEKMSVSCFFCDFAYELEQIRNSMS